MLAWLLKALLALNLHGHACTATTFGWAGDRLRGGQAVCLHRDLRPGETGVAHRTLPCGTTVALYNPRTKKVTTAPVVDRGPYGAVDEWGGWLIKRLNADPGRWRGCLDLTEATAAQLDHNGMERVVYAPVQ